MFQFVLQHPGLFVMFACRLSKIKLKLMFRRFWHVEKCPFVSVWKKSWCLLSNKINNYKEKSIMEL